MTLDQWFYLAAFGLGLLIIIITKARRQALWPSLEHMQRSSRWLFIQPLVLASWLISAAGVGLLAREAGVNWWLSGLIALAGGLAVGLLLYRMLIERRIVQQAGSAASKVGPIGHLGVVVEALPAEGFGVVAYEHQKGAARINARAIGGRAIEAGCAVMIVEVNDQGATVLRLESLES
ncbi:hypothetical protein [Herpetosiphon sp. NSE202]|uniref:hypothetical protein n=1 Tax=Herpetosiphon sp. NSE202 TaxID=3351349 RepID=UPI003640B3C7